MTSSALTAWQGPTAAELNEIERARSGTKRRSKQLNYAYATLLSARFQGFCRDLHSEAALHLVFASKLPAGSDLANVFSGALTRNRHLDRGNPTRGNIGSDFAFLGLTKLWDDVYSHRAGNKEHGAALDQLMRWRNAIVHHDFSGLSGLTGSEVTLKAVRSWRSSCDQLAIGLDAVVADGVYRTVGARPW